MTTVTIPRPSALDQPGFSSPDTARFAGVTFRQLQYWVRTDRVTPSLNVGRGLGSRRRYSYGDLLILRVMGRLLDGGVKLDVVVRAIGPVREAFAADSVSGVLLVHDSWQWHVLGDAAELIPLTHGIGNVLTVLRLDEVKAELDAALAASVVVGIGEPVA